MTTILTYIHYGCVVASVMHLNEPYNNTPICRTAAGCLHHTQQKRSLTAECAPWMPWMPWMVERMRTHRMSIRQCANAHARGGHAFSAGLRECVGGGGDTTNGLVGRSVGRSVGRAFVGSSSSSKHSLSTLVARGWLARAACSLHTP